MWKYILILFTVLWLNNSCSKDKNGNTNNTNNNNGCVTNTLPFLPDGMVNYFGSYKIGSWWVYEDSTGKVKDSSYVTTYGRSGGGVQTVCDNSGVASMVEDNINVIIASTLFDQLRYQIVSNGNDSASNFIMIGQSQSSFFVYEANGVFTSGYDNYTNKATILDSFSVLGITYKNVLKFNGFSDGPVYFALNIGIIQTVYSNTYGDRIMRLKYYHIN